MYFGAGYWGRLFWGPGYWHELGDTDCSGGPYVYIQYWAEGYAQCDESENPDCSGGPYVPVGYWQPGYALCDETASIGTGAGGGRIPIRFPQVPSMKPRDRRRRHEEDLLIVIL